MKKDDDKISSRQNEKSNTKVSVRINKYLALKNYATRRGADTLIEKRQVFINGRIAVLGDKVSENDKVEVRFGGKHEKEKTYIYMAYNKPVGIVTHSAEENQKDIKQATRSITEEKGLFPVGRLDRDSHGLIILTNDGRITDRLLGPNYMHEKEYMVKTKSNLRSSFKAKMEAGVQIDGEKTKKCKVEIINNRAFKVTLTEGKKHQIRRMCVSLFQEVEDLKRIRIMNITLGKLPSGAHRTLKGEELKTFLSSLGL